MKTALASISTVERDTGLSKDTLRVWERRYGFPQPLRDSNGERVYPADQLEKLRIIRRLMDSGLRPGKVVTESLQELNARIQSLPQCTPRLESDISATDPALQLLKAHQIAQLRQYLAHEMLRRGLQRFVLEVVAPLNVLVGNAWIDGRIQIFEEHLYSEQIQQLLRQAISSIVQVEQAPRVLLTTLPGEKHKIGLLMAEAYLAIEGAQCISLGVETPAWDVVQAAREHRVDIVGLSCSQAVPVILARSGIADLRRQLDLDIALWAGGSIWQRARKQVPGVTPIASLDEIPIELKAWRAQHADR